MTYKVEERSVLLDNSFVKIWLKRIRRNAEAPQDYYWIDFRDFCNVIPVTADGKVVFVRQYRVGIEAETIEIPGGVTDPKDPGARESALREMAEETGYGQLPGARVLTLGWTHPNPAVQGNKCHYFACGPVALQTEIQNDPNEHTEVVLIPIDEIRKRMRAGAMTHALTMNAFQMLELEQNGPTFEPFETRLHRLCKGE
jgi:8-oxo-dGTP pyrophosphatase MutT (NUDIX family)